MSKNHITIKDRSVQTELHVTGYGSDGLIINTVRTSSNVLGNPVSVPVSALLAAIDTVAPSALAAYVKAHPAAAPGAVLVCESEADAQRIAREWNRSIQQGRSTGAPAENKPDPDELAAQMREISRRLGESCRALADAFHDSFKRSSR